MGGTLYGIVVLRDDVKEISKRQTLDIPRLGLERDGREPDAASSVRYSICASILSWCTLFASRSCFCSSERAAMALRTVDAMFSGRFFSARRAPSSASSISATAEAAKAQNEGVLRGPYLRMLRFLSMVDMTAES